MKPLHLKGATFRWLAVASLALCTAAHSRECWIDDLPQRNEGAAPSSRQDAESLDRVARQLNAIFHRNPSLNQMLEGPEPARLRTRWSVGRESGNGQRRSLWMQVRDHRREMWIGSCDLNKNADRIEPRASIVVHVDAPDALLERRAIYDEKLTAWAEPPLTGHAAGRPVYFGWLVVLSADGRVPWEPVSMDEYLQFHQRELERTAAASKKASEQMTRQDDGALEKQALQVYESMRKFDPAAAAKVLADLRAQMPAAKAQAQRNVNSGERISSEQLAALQAFRSSLPAQVLRSQARLGWTGPVEGELLERMPLLVKVRQDWAYGTAKENSAHRPRLIGLIVQGKGPYADQMQEVLRNLDYSAIEELVKTPQQK